MGNSIHYNSCPVCGAASVEKTIRAKDHSVSGEQFDILHCKNCQVQFTQDVPDAEAIANYYQSENYISHSNSSKGIINRVYQIIRNRANVQKRKLIEKITGLKTGNLLDVGSGTGYFTAEMKKGGWQVTGLEPDEGARKIASDINKIQLAPREDLFHLPLKNFDVITLWHVLEHIHDLSEYLHQIKNLLKESGILFVAVPNYKSYDAKKYGKYWAAYDVPRHLYHFCPDTMNMLMKKEGLKIIDIKPMWFDSFYVSLLSSKYKNGRVNWPGAIFTALQSNMKAMRDLKKCSSLIYIISK